MSKLGPKCQYFVWPPLFSSTALTLLGMEFTRASQVATGVSSTPLWRYHGPGGVRDLALLHLPLRMAPRCSIGFRSGDMLGSPSPLPSASWRCVGVVMLEYCPAAQSPKGGDHALLQYVTVHLGIMVPSMNCSSPVPAALMQPQTMTLPPPCLIVGKTTCLCTPHLVAATHAWHYLNQISYLGLIRPQAWFQ